MRALKKLSATSISTFFLVFVTTLLLGIFSVLNYRATKDRAWASLRHNLSNSSNQLVAGLAIPVWNIDVPQIHKIIESTLLDQEIYSVRVDTGVQVFSGHTSNKDPALTKDLISENQNIIYQGQKIGSALLIVTPAYLFHSIYRQQMMFVELIILVDLAIILSLYFLGSSLILRPLQRVGLYAKLASAGVEFPPEARVHALPSEITNLNKSIKKMVSLLKSRLEQAQESEEIYRTLFACEPDSLLIIDCDSLTLLDANNAADKLYDYSHEELLMLKISDLTDDPLLSSDSLKLLKPGEIIQSKTYRHRRKDASIFPVETSGHALILHNRLSLVMAVRDVTERVRAENSLRIAKEKAEKAERVKSDFLDLAAHELKTPLTPLSILLEMVQKNIQSKNSTQAEVWENINRQVERLSEIVSDLTNVNQFESGILALNFAKSNLSEIVSICVNEFRQHNAKRHISVSSPKEIVAEVDPERIRQVLANLVDNAIKYTPENTPIEIVVQKTEQEHVRVSVQDHGQGIPESEQGTLFTRFFRVLSDTTLKHSGLGLGLYYCRKILEKHKGFIAIESRQGEGSKFYFEIPITQVEK